MVLKNRDRKSNLQGQKITLFVVVVVGILLVGGLILVRNNSREIRISTLESQTEVFSLTQDFVVEILVSTYLDDPESQETKILNGKIIENVLVEETSLNEAINNSKRRAQKEIEGDETLWGTPLNDLDEDNLEFPIEFSWISFSQEALNNTALEKVIAENNLNEGEFALDTVNISALNLSEDPNTYTVGVKVTLSLNDLIE